MKRYVRLLDYKDNPKKYTIENFENVALLHFKVLSGDGVLTVIYKDGTTETFDSSDCRLTDFNDGEWHLPPKYLGAINLMKSHYDFDKLDRCELKEINNGIK